MKIAFSHYWVGERDGVNTIMYRNIAGLQKSRDNWEFTLVGKVSENAPEFELSYDQKFNYLDIPEFTPSHCEKSVSDCTVDEYMACGDNLFEIMKEKYEPFDVIVAENLQVGNFPPLVYAYYRYAKWCLENHKDKKFLFRAHDFFWHRPENFENVTKFNSAENPDIPDWHTIFFPNLPNIYFVAINIQSMNYIYEHGISEKQLIFFPNCLDDKIHIPDEKTPGFRRLLSEHWGIEEDEEILFSPIRCAPRKNVEESILLLVLLNRLNNPELDVPKSILHNMRFRLVLSMSIEEGKAAPYSDAIQTFIKENNIPMHIGFKGLINLEREYDEDGEILTYGLSDAYGVSWAVLTTSILEGFGFIFLEPWLTGSMLFGRNIHAVTNDFKLEADIRFEHLYEKLTVNGIDFPDIGKKQSYIVKGGNILDIEQLDEKLKIIKRIAEDDDFLVRFVKENATAVEDLVTSIRHPELNQYLIIQNMEKIKKYYSQEYAAENFVKIVKKVTTE